MKQSYRDEEKKQRLTLNDVDNEFYVKALVRNGSASSSRASHDRLMNAYNFLKDHIENKYKSEELEGLLNLVDFLKDKLLIIINCFNPKNPGQNSFPVLTQEFKR